MMTHRPRSDRFRGSLQASASDWLLPVAFGR
jgi:hypothetical protein